MSIEKRIIYCWFGENQLSELEQKCIESWTECCPDYEIMKISEDTPGFTMNKYAKDAYDHGNYSFVSDYARLWALQRYSGIYLDTDIKLLRPLDSLLKYDAFVAMSGVGFYNSVPIARGETFPAIFQEAMDKLVDGRCLNSLLNKIIYSHYDVFGSSYHEFDNIAFLGNRWFVTDNYNANALTYGIHYCNGSWLNKWQGSYDKGATFIPFQVYQDGVRDTNAEKKFFGSVIEKNDIVLHSYRMPVARNHIFYANFFYNPRMAYVEGNHFTIYRTKYSTEKYNMEEHTIWNGDNENLRLHLVIK